MSDNLTELLAKIEALRAIIELQDREITELREALNQVRAQLNQLQQKDT